MKFYEYGKKNEATVVMIHGAFMSYEMLQPLADELKKHYHVILVSLPGHETKDEEEFTTIWNIAKRIETALWMRGLGHIHCLYGLSVGGAVAMRILADQRMRIDTAIIDAGITPRPLAQLPARIRMAKEASVALAVKKNPSLLYKTLPTREYPKNMADKIYEVLQGMSFTTLKNMLYTIDNYYMPTVFPRISTKVQYWYGEEESEDRKRDFAFVNKYIPNITFEKMPGMNHGQYVLSYPKEAAQKMEELMEGTRKRINK
ncbi:MAG: alpha/beta hydrolase [Lachnospiraceae bacterium]|nr:alpha/beta hydrolase [Lachnospiraceae bacterium]